MKSNRRAKLRASSDRRLRLYCRADRAKALHAALLAAGIDASRPMRCGARDAYVTAYYDQSIGKRVAAIAAQHGACDKMGRRTVSAATLPTERDMFVFDDPTSARQFAKAAQQMGGRVRLAVNKVIVETVGDVRLRERLDRLAQQMGSVKTSHEIKAASTREPLGARRLGKSFVQRHEFASEEDAELFAASFGFATRGRGGPTKYRAEVQCSQGGGQCQVLTRVQSPAEAGWVAREAQRHGGVRASAVSAAEERLDPMTTETFTLKTPRSAQVFFRFVTRELDPRGTVQVPSGKRGSVQQSGNSVVVTYPWDPRELKWWRDYATKIDSGVSWSKTTFRAVTMKGRFKMQPEASSPWFTKTSQKQATSGSEIKYFFGGEPVYVTQPVRASAALAQRVKASHVRAAAKSAPSPGSDEWKKQWRRIAKSAGAMGAEIEQVAKALEGVKTYQELRGKVGKFSSMLDPFTVLEEATRYLGLKPGTAGASVSASNHGKGGGMQDFSYTFRSPRQAAAFAQSAIASSGGKVTCDGCRVSVRHHHKHGAALLTMAQEAMGGAVKAGLRKSPPTAENDRLAKSYAVRFINSAMAREFLGKVRAANYTATFDGVKTVKVKLLNDVERREVDALAKEYKSSYASHLRCSLDKKNPLHVKYAKFMNKLVKLPAMPSEGIPAETLKVYSFEGDYAYGTVPKNLRDPDDYDGEREFMIKDLARAKLA